jgi:predicted dehydrogenase
MCTRCGASFRATAASTGGEVLDVAIVGCGLIGQKRLRALGDEHRLVAAADSQLERAEALAARQPGAIASNDWRIALDQPGVEAVIVATTNDWLAPITLAAVERGKPVLVEKPAARTPEELRPVIRAAKRAGVCVQVGFNHRYHPALQKAHELFESGVLGPLMFIRGRYGHGGRPGYEREWRSDPVVAGGGELLDQGVHLIDLARWFLGDFAHVDGFAHTYYWSMPVEDNGFLCLRTPSQQVAWLHASCTEWKNLFSFEIYGRSAKLHVEGLGGSYGTERLAYYKMLPQMGPPETTIWEYPGDDLSWKHEFENFTASVQGRRSCARSLDDALAALEIVQSVYRKSRPGTPAPIAGRADAQRVEAMGAAGS